MIPNPVNNDCPSTLDSIAHPKTYSSSPTPTLLSPYAAMQACVPAAQQLLSACRAAGLTVVHTKEAHLADLSDCHHSKATRGNLPKGMCIGDEGAMGRLLVRDEPGNEIIPEVAPLEVSRKEGGGAKVGRANTRERKEGKLARGKKRGHKAKEGWKGQGRVRRI
jgi:nicotinamidase-related amidase